MAKGPTASSNVRTGKRAAILAGGLTIFARDGFTRASIDEIAAASEVSTRTIYNHFDNKAGLFHAVILESATGVADSQIALFDRHLHKIVDLRADLEELGRDLSSPKPEHRDHFSLVRQINAEAGHIPSPAIDAWQEAGPRRVLGALAEHLRTLGERGLLVVEDPHIAAVHYMLLVSGSVSFQYGVRSPSDAKAVAAGVRVFLRGYTD